MPDNSGTHLKATPAAVHELCKRLPSKAQHSPIDAYSCDLHILDAVQDSQLVTCVALEDWHQA